MLTSYGAGFDRKIVPSSTKLKDSRPGPSECAGRVPGVTGRWGGPPGSRWAEGQTWQLPGGGSSDPAAYLGGSLRERGSQSSLRASFHTSTLRQMLRVPDLPGPCPTALCEEGACPFHRWEAGVEGGSPHALHGGRCSKGCMRLRAEGVLCPAVLLRPTAGLVPWLGSPALSLASSCQGPSPEISPTPPPPSAWGSAPPHCAFHSKTVSIDSRSTFAKPSPGLPLPASETISCNLLGWGSAWRGACGHLRGGPGTSWGRASLGAHFHSPHAAWAGPSSVGSHSVLGHEYCHWPHSPHWAK